MEYIGIGMVYMAFSAFGIAGIVKKNYWCIVIAVVMMFCYSASDDLKLILQIHQAGEPQKSPARSDDRPDFEHKTD